jgi:hypothetical protein
MEYEDLDYLTCINIIYHVDCLLKLSVLVVSPN